jgi:hypothetical protein
MKTESHIITNKYAEAASVVQQVHKVLNDIDILAGCTPAKSGGKFYVDLYREQCGREQSKLLQSSSWEGFFQRSLRHARRETE